MQQNSKDSSTFKIIMTISLIVILATSSLYSKDITHSGKTFEVILSEYRKKVDKLKVDKSLEQKLSELERMQLNKALKKAQKQLDSVSKKIAKIQKYFNTIDSNNTTLLKAKEILSTKGTTQTIEYLQAISKQKPIDPKSRDVVKELQLLIDLLRFENRHKETLKFNIEKLHLYRELAKSNPVLYKPKIADTLYELISEYDYHEQYDNMLKAHSEALSLYRELKDKQKIVDIIYKGMYYADYSKEVLKEAKTFLFKRKYKPEELSSQMHNAGVSHFIQKLIYREKYNLAIKHPQVNIYKLNEYWRIHGVYLKKKYKDEQADYVEGELKILKLLSSTKKSLKQKEADATISLHKNHYGMSLEKMMQDRWFLHEYQLSEGLSVVNKIVVHKNRAFFTSSGTTGFSFSSNQALVIKLGKKLYIYNMGGLHAHL